MSDFPDSADLNDVARLVDDYDVIGLIDEETIELDEHGSRALAKLREKRPDVPEAELLQMAIENQLKRLSNESARRSWLRDEVAQTEKALGFHKKMLAALDACMGELVEIAARDAPSPALAMAQLLESHDPDDVERVLMQARRRGFLWPTT